MSSKDSKHGCPPSPKNSTADFEQAILNGSTNIRVGSTIFRARAKK